MLYFTVYLLGVSCLVVGALAEDYNWSVPDPNHPQEIKRSQIPKRDSLFDKNSKNSPESLVLKSEKDSTPQVYQVKAKSARKSTEERQPLRLRKVCRHPEGCQKRPGGLHSLLEFSASNMQLSLLDSYDKQVNNENESKLVTKDLETTTQFVGNLTTFGNVTVKEPLQDKSIKEESQIHKRPSTIFTLRPSTLNTPTEPILKNRLHSSLLSRKQHVIIPDIEFTTVPATTKRQGDGYKTNVEPKTSLKSNPRHNLMKEVRLTKIDPGSRRKFSSLRRTTTTTTTKAPDPEYIYEYEEVEEDEEESFSAPAVPHPTLLDISGIFPDEYFESVTEAHIFSDKENKNTKFESELESVDDLLDTTTIDVISDIPQYTTLRASSIKETIKQEMKERRQNLFSRRKPVNILTTVMPPSDTTVIPALKILQQKVADRVKPKMKSQDISSAATFQIKTQVPFGNKVSNLARPHNRNRYPFPLKEATSTTNINLRKVPLKSEESRTKGTGIPKGALSLIPQGWHVASASELKPIILTHKSIGDNFQETIEESPAPSEEATQFTIPIEEEKHAIPSTTERVLLSSNVEKSSYIPRLFKATTSPFLTEPTTSRKKFVPKHFPKPFFNSIRMPEIRTSSQSTVRPQFSTIRNVFKVRHDRLNPLTRLRSTIATTQSPTSSEPPFLTTRDSIEINETNKDKSELNFFSDEENKESLPKHFPSTELSTEEILSSTVAETAETLPLETELTQLEDDVPIGETTFIPPFEKFTQSTSTNIDLDQNVDKPGDAKQIRERTDATSTIEPNEEVTSSISINHFPVTEKNNIKTEQAIISDSFTHPQSTEITKPLFEGVKSSSNAQTYSDEVNSSSAQTIDSDTVLQTSTVHDFSTSAIASSITPPTQIKIITSIITSKSERRVFFNKSQRLEADKNFRFLMKQNQTLPSKQKSSNSIVTTVQPSPKNSMLLSNSTLSYDSDRTTMNLDNSVMRSVSPSTIPELSIQTEKNNASPQLEISQQVFSDHPPLNSMDFETQDMNTHANDETDPMTAGSEVVIHMVELKNNEKLQKKSEEKRKEVLNKVIPKYKFPPNDAISFYATSTPKSLFKDYEMPAFLSNIRYRSNTTNEPIKIYSSYTNVLLQ